MTKWMLPPLTWSETWNAKSNSNQLKMRLIIKKALCAVSPYFDDEPELGTPEADQFEVLLILIEAYEAKHHAIMPPNPIEAIKFRMEQGGLTSKDLEPMIGRSNRVYEILAGRRPLTLAMIRKLHSGLGIPAESLIG